MGRVPLLYALAVILSIPGLKQAVEWIDRRSVRRRLAREGRSG